MRDKVEKLLKNYRSYKYAKTQYEKHKPIPQAGVANYDAMPSGSGAPELLFAQQGRMADMGHTSLSDVIDYRRYSEAVEAVEGALDTLTDEERSIIKLKWMDNLSLQQIADVKHMTLSTVKGRHKSALSSLGICFRFIQPPHIEEVPVKGSQHMKNAVKTNRFQHMDVN